MEEFSHIFVFYEFHKSEKDFALLVNPYLDEKKHGLFATRFPCRLNPLGFSVVRLLTRKENILFITGADMFDGSPLLAIKPYIPEFDLFNATRTSWFKNRSVE